MSQNAEIEYLRRQLNQMAEDFDASLSRKYHLEFWVPEPEPPPSLYRRIRGAAGRLLRWFGLLETRPPPPPPPPPEPWLTELKSIDYGAAANPLLVWAPGVDRDELHKVCTRIQKMQTRSPGWAPVLVTDVADFAFFSRLKWLVEYVPSLSAPAEGYSECKLRYLAWRHRDIPALPATADFRDDTLLEDLFVG